MGRRLPWKTADDAAEPSPRRTPQSGGPAPPPKSTPSRGPHSTPTPRRSRAPESRLQPCRTPSTSPPPEPPTESLMLAGALADDRYRMVEDEFLHTAQRFTTHLHRAEYNRLKARAESQNAAAIRAIARPVVGPLATPARVRREAARRDAKQRSLLRAAAAGGAGPGPEPPVGTGLQGLLERPRSDTRSISSYAPTHSTTRAAAGYKPTSSANHPHDTLSSQHRDHLSSSPAPGVAATSRVPASTQRSASQRHHVQHVTPRTGRDPVSLATSGDGAGNQTPSRSGSVRDTTQDNQTRDRWRAATGLKHTKGNEDDDEDPFGISRRKARREQSRKPGDKDPPKKLSPDTIPSFL